MKEAITTIAAPLEGGFYAGRIKIDGAEYAIITAPKALGQFNNICWSKRSVDVQGALSFCDGLANTRAMAESGSEIAQRVLSLRIGGFDDWYIGAVDETELCYRNLKPGRQKNSLFYRSGINLSAVPPTYPYTADFPAQTLNELFKSGGSEAFVEDVYLTSTQHASSSDCAWLQLFGYGTQNYWLKDVSCRVRAVRRLVITN